MIGTLQEEPSQAESDLGLTLDVATLLLRLEGRRLDRLIADVAGLVPPRPQLRLVEAPDCTPDETPL